MASSISRAVRDAIKAQLSDAVNGFNVNLAAIASSYGVAAFEVDWSDTSTNFIMGRIDPDMVEETSPFSYPLLTIDTENSTHDNFVKFAEFAGKVTAIIEVTLSWEQGQTIPDFASYADAVEDAMFKSMNNQAFQAWPSGVLYNGITDMSRGRIIEAGENWRQQLPFVAAFRRIIP